MKLAGKICFALITYIITFYGCKEKYPNESVIAVPDYKKGENLLGVKNDSAFYYFNKVANTSRDSLQIATSYNNMAAIQSDASDYFGSQESLLLSLRYLDESKERDYFCLASDYNELGTSSLKLKNYTAAIHYYDQAMKFSKDDNFKTVIVNNKAYCYQRMGAYGKSLGLYNSIVGQSKKDNRSYARIITNMAMTKWLMDSGYNAGPELLMALALRRHENDQWGLNSSYMHLAEFYRNSRPDSALFYAGNLYQISKQLGSPDDEIDALQKLIILSRGTDVRPYFIRYQFLNDSIQSARNNAKNQFALIRYDAEKRLNDNLKLQRDNSDKKLQIVWQRVLLYSIISLLLLVAWLAVTVYRKRRKKMIWETQNAIRESQLKTSQKVHDVVANGLYRIMSEIEHKPDIDKEQLLDHIDALYERSRDISYEQPKTSSEDFGEIVAALLISFASPVTKILVTGNNKEVWKDVDDKSRKELENILQELMVNMKKHSEAKNVVIRFSCESNLVNMVYTDDGIGLAPGFKYGNGLVSTENRIKGLGGRIIFDRAVVKGMKIQVHFPIINQ